MRKNHYHAALGAIFCLPFAVSASPSSELNLEHISIISSRIPQPSAQLTTSVTVLDQALIEQQLSLSLADLLRIAPGVGVSSSGGLGKNTALRIRGEESFRTRLYIDGVELSDPAAPQIGPVFDDLLTFQVSQVEILRGTQGLSYGADAGGVIQIHTATPKDGFDAAGTATISRYDTQSLTGYLSAANKTGTLFVGASKLSSDGFNAQTVDTSKEADGYDNTTLHVKGKVNITENLSISAVYRNVEAENQYDGCYDNITFAVTHDCQSDADNSTLKLALSYQQKQHNHRFSLKQTDVQRSFYSNSEFGFANEGRIREVDYLGSSQFDNIDLVYGIQAKQESISGQQKRWHKGVFTEVLGELTSQLYVNAGLRFDDNDTFGKHLSYRSGLAKVLQVTPHSMIKVRATWGTGFRAPSLYEQNYNDGPFAFGEAAGLALIEETSEGGDIGLEYFHDSGFSAETTWYRQSIENEIVFDPVSYQGYLQLDGKSRSQGVELALAYPVVDSFDLWGNYTYNDAKDSQSQPRLRRPRHTINIGINSSYLADRLNLTIQARGVRDAIDIGATALDDYVVASVSVQYALSAIIDLKFGIDNLFNRDYQEVIGFNMPQRSVQFALTARLP